MTPANTREETNSAPALPAPLHGRCILLTRQRSQSTPLRRLLEQAGAQVLELPLIELAAPPDTAPVDTAIRQLATYAWVVFTSPNAVAFFWERLQAARLDAAALAGTAAAALGPGTAAALAVRGLNAALVPCCATQAGLLAALQQQALRGRRLLIPASELADGSIDAQLEACGARVTRVVVYTNRPPTPDPAALAALDAVRTVDAVVFASPSAVANLPVCAGPERARRVLATATVACIGPATAAAVRQRGYAVAIQPESGSTAALAAALGAHFGSARKDCP